MSDSPAIDDPANQPPTESTSRTWRLARKELREILRDRRTVITLVLMPLLVYPLLGVIMRKGVLSNLSLQNAKAHLCVETDSDLQIFTVQVLRGSRLRASQFPDKSALFEAAPEEPTLPMLQGTQQPLQYEIYSLTDEHEGETLEQQIREGYADLAVRIVPETDRNRAHPGGIPFVKWEFIHTDGAVLSERAVGEITQCLEALNEAHTQHLLSQNGLSAEKPAVMSTRALKSAEAGRSPLITFIPLVLVLMTMTGAVYPAIDLTAGERERGTMEILVAAPVSRMTLLSGKFLAVLVVALLTATMNMISMFATLFALGLEGTILGNVGPAMIFQVMVLMVVFAAFFSAVLLSITSVARSFKEAQAYLVPLMLISLTPGIFSLMPDLEINGLLAVTPLVNTVLMARDLLLGEVNVLMFAIVLISTALYGMLALGLAARIFGSDSVLHGSGGTWTELLKRPATPLRIASLPVALSCLAVVFSLFIVFGSLPGRMFESLKNQLFASGVTTIILFAAIPVVGAMIARVSLKTGFALHRSKWTMWLAAILLGCSLWVFAYEANLSLMSQERVEYLKQLFAGFELNLDAVPLWVKLFALAIAPAVCEEFFFRGFLQNSIRQQTSATLAILCAGVLFGLFHVIVKDALMYERLIPSTFMGIVLGIVFERSGSVLPGMLLHVIHNGFLICVSHYEERLKELGIGMIEQQHLPTTWLAYAVVPVAIAAWLLWNVTSRQHFTETVEDA